MPAQVGDRGNEQADQRAKAAAAQHCDARFPLPHTAMNLTIRRSMTKRGNTRDGDLARPEKTLPVERPEDIPTDR